jgi:hypothetical protein
VRRIKSLSWPVVHATVTNSVHNRASYGCDTTDIHFDYSFEGQDFSGFHEEPVLFGGSGKEFAQRFPAGTQIKVRVKSSNPDTTVALIS